MKRVPPPDSHVGDPKAPYRCQELRDDSSRVLLGRAAPELVRRYDAHRVSCESCRHFHAVMQAAYTAPRVPGRRSERELDQEFRGVLGRLDQDRSRPVFAWAGAAAFAGAVALLVAYFALRTGPAPQAPQEIVLDAGLEAGQERGPGRLYPNATMQIPNRVGAFAHHAQVFGRVVSGSARLSDAQGRPAAPQSFRPGTTLSAEGDDAQVALFGRVLINLQDGALAQWTRATHDLIELSLERGRLAVRYDRESDDPVLQIRTPEALVRVVGTVFTVEVDEAGHTIVAVLRGRVEVLHPDTGSRIATVDAGYRYDVANTTFADVSRAEVVAALPLGERIAEGAGDVPDRWIVPGLSDQADMRTLSRVPDPRSSDARHKDVRDAEQTPTVDAPPSNDESAELIAALVAQAERDRRHEVQAALEHCRGLYLDAQSRPRAPRCLDAFMRSYADEPEALEGLLLIGILRMDYAHDYQAATRRFEAFLRKAPNHPRAQLAMYKLTLAAIESGQIAKAVQRGQAYLERYPNGQYVGHILQRFPELRGRI